MTRQRPRKKPTRGQIEAENDRLREALEDIADILEDAGVLEPSDPDFDEGYEDEPDEPDIIKGEVKILNEEPKGE